MYRAFTTTVRRWLAGILFALVVAAAGAAGAQTLVGQWDWGAGGGLVTVAPDGTGRDGRGNTMTWTARNLAERLYELRWSHGFTDEARLSADGREVAVVNNVGTRFVATRHVDGPAGAAGSRSPWTSLRPGVADMPLRVTAGTGFLPGRYSVFVANADPDGTAVSDWATYGPVEIRAGEAWSATLLSSAGLRFDRSGAPPTGSGAAVVRASNADARSWQAICILPEGRMPRPDCFGASAQVADAGSGATAQTFSRWTSITPRGGQFAGQPGGLMPLPVEHGPLFAVGRYRIYIADAGPAGRTISRWTMLGPIELQGGDKYEATLLSGVRLRLLKNAASLNLYPTPDPRHAMIWARNDAEQWQALCVLPEGLTVEERCFGGSSNITFVAPDAAAPGPVTFAKGLPLRPMLTDLVPLRVQNDIHFVVGRYMVYLAETDAGGAIRSAWTGFGPIELRPGDRIAAVLKTSGRVELRKDDPGLSAFPTPDAGHAMIWARNEEPSTWRAICVLPTGMDAEATCPGTPVPPSEPEATMTFEGEVRFRSANSTRDAIGRLTLIVKGDRVTGSFLSEGESSLTKGRISASITGRRSATGRFTGTLEGRSQSTSKLTGSARDDDMARLMSLFGSFPFTGSIEGRLERNAGSGTIVFNKRGEKPSDRYWSGTWSVKR